MPIDGYFLRDKCADRGSRRSDDSRIASQCPFAVLSEPSVARYVTASGVPLLQPPPPLDGPPPRPSLPPRCATLAFLPPMRRAAGARGSTHLPSPETQHTMWSHRGAGQRYSRLHWRTVSMRSVAPLTHTSHAPPQARPPPPHGRVVRSPRACLAPPCAMYLPPWVAPRSRHHNTRQAKPTAG